MLLLQNSSECRTTESITNFALWCSVFLGPSSHFLRLLGNRTIRSRNIDMDLCKLLSHKHQNVPLLETITGGLIFFYYITPFTQKNIISIGPFLILQATLNHDFHLFRFIEYCNDLSKKMAIIILNNNIITNLMARLWVRY